MSSSSSPVSGMASDSSLPLVKDDLYYFGPWTIVRVEQTLFQVPRKEFQEQSEVFQDMFAVPPIKDAKPDGQSDEQPLRLEGIAAEDFRCFLKTLFPRPVFQIDTPDTDKELETALRLATMWRFDTLRKHLIKQLAAMNLTPARKLQLARVYDIPTWYNQELRTLALRDASLTLEEASQVGLEFAAIVSALRDERYNAVVGGSFSLPRGENYVQGHVIKANFLSRIEERIRSKLAIFSRDLHWPSEGLTVCGGIRLPDNVQWKTRS